MKKENKKLYDLMVNKSTQSFMLAIELYNKPTINLNIEGFSIFICNAWELMLKAYLLSKGESIYFLDKKTKVKTNRTLDLNSLIKRIMTNDKDPIRINLETIIGIRNKATHLIIPEYSYLLHDVFEACINNYCIKINLLLNININSLFNSTFFSLTIPSSNINNNIIGKYGKTIENEYYNFARYIEESYKRNANNQGIVNDKFAIGHEVKFVKAKNINEANLIIGNSKDANMTAIKVEKEIDVASKYPLLFGEVLDKISIELITNNITFNSYTKNGKSKFTKDTLNLYIRVKDIKSDNSIYSYKHKSSKTASTYTYSLLLVEKIIQDIVNDPDIFIKFKQLLKN